jgi:hypothetical protein
MAKAGQVAERGIPTLTGCHQSVLPAFFPAYLRRRSLGRFEGPARETGGPDFGLYAELRGRQNDPEIQE